MIYIYGTLYNNIGRIRQCIESISPLSPYVLYVGDNMSDDGSYRYLQLLQQESKNKVVIFRWRHTRGMSRDLAMKKLIEAEKPKPTDTMLYIDFDTIYNKSFIELSRNAPANGIIVDGSIGPASINSRYGWRDLHVAEDFERLARMKHDGIRIVAVKGALGENDPKAGDDHRYNTGIRFYTRAFKDMIDTQRGLAFKSFREFYAIRRHTKPWETPAWFMAYCIANLMGVYAYDDKEDNRSYVLGGG